MVDTYKDLKEKREAFNSFFATVLPAEALNQESLRFSELAGRIGEETVRKKFCQLAIAMLDANIAHYRDHGTPRRNGGPSHVVEVASTLIVAGLVQYSVGTAGALVAAGLWYWFAAATAARWAKDVADEAQVHNRNVAGWSETLKALKSDRDSLRAL